MSTSSGPQTALERIAFFGWRHRISDERSPVQPEARFGVRAWMHMMRDPQVRWVDFGRSAGRVTTFEWGGVKVVEDESVPIGDVVFVVAGEEVGRITDAEFGEREG